MNNLLSKRHISSQWHGRVVEVFVVIHPHFRRSSSVFGKHNSATPWEGVRMFFPEYMTHLKLVIYSTKFLQSDTIKYPAAGNNLQATPTLPHSEGNFKVFCSPNVHLHIIFAQLVKIGFVYNEQSSSYHRSFDFLLHINK